jgi:hypothetical protein
VDPKILAFARYASYHVKIYQTGECHLRREQTFADLKPYCLQRAPDAKNVLLWGDSVVAHYIYGFQNGGQRLGLHFLHTSMGACPPIIGFVHPALPNCRSFNDDAFSFVKTQRPDAVVMAGTWNILIRQFGADAVWGPLHKSVKAVVDQGIPVILFGPPVEFVDNLPYILSHFAITGLDRFDPNKFMDPFLFETDTRMKKEFSGIKGVHYVSVLDTLCSPKCPAVLEGHVPLTWDIHHLTQEGSVLAAGKLLPRIADVVDGHE